MRRMWRARRARRVMGSISMVRVWVGVGVRRLSWGESGAGWEGGGVDIFEAGGWGAWCLVWCGFELV